MKPVIPSERTMKAVIPSERSESRNLLRAGDKRFLDFTPLRSVPLGMTGK